MAVEMDRREFLRTTMLAASAAMTGTLPFTTYAAQASDATTNPSVLRAIDAFVPFATPGLEAFVIWSSTYAPPMRGVPAQLFLGEWTGARSADIAVWEPDTNQWKVIGFEDFNITYFLMVDPFRPVVYLSSPNHLYDIDRRTLQARKLIELPRQHSIDIDGQGRIWCNARSTRPIYCYDTNSAVLTKHENVVPEEMFYADGTTTLLGTAPDGRIWFITSPIASLCVYDPAARKTTVVWTPGQDKNGKKNSHELGCPVVIGNLVMAGQLFVDATTLKMVDVPFETGPDGYHLMAGLARNRLPTPMIDQHGKVLARKGTQVGWLTVANGKFELIGHVPARFNERYPGELYMPFLHGEKTLLGDDRFKIQKIDIQTQQWDQIDLNFKPLHPQCMYFPYIGPRDNLYASGMCHALWQVAPDGQFSNLGDVIRTRSGELHFMTHQGEKLYIAAYTGGILTRIDFSRPMNNWGTEAHNNPRCLIDQYERSQHRPRGLAITPDSRLYFTSNSDYCLRREGGLVILNTQTEMVEQIIDPLLPGEQLWEVAVSKIRPEVYIGTSEGTLIVWDHESRKIKKTFKLKERPGDGVMTGAMIKTGGVRFLGVTGDLVAGTRFGADYELFYYHADSGEMVEPPKNSRGKAFGLWAWKKRGTLIVRFNSTLYELGPTGDFIKLYDEPVPMGAFGILEDSNGKLFMTSSTSVFTERDPVIHTLPPVKFTKE